jgi:hypothetical protein
MQLPLTCRNAYDTLVLNAEMTVSDSLIAYQEECQQFQYRSPICRGCYHNKWKSVILMNVMIRTDHQIVLFHNMWNI